MIHRSSMSAITPLPSGVPSRASRTRPQQALLSILLIAGVVLVLCLYLLQTTKTTVKTVNIRELQTKYERLQRQNSNLLAIHAYNQSISQMSQRAKQAGFQPVKSVYFLPLEENRGNGTTVTLLPSAEPDTTSNPALSLTMR